MYARPGPPHFHRRETKRTVGLSGAAVEGRQPKEGAAGRHCACGVPPTRPSQPVPSDNINITSGGGVRQLLLAPSSSPSLSALGGTAVVCSAWAAAALVSRERDGGRCPREGARWVRRGQKRVGGSGSSCQCTRRGSLSPQRPAPPSLASPPRPPTHIPFRRGQRAGERLRAVPGLQAAAAGEALPPPPPPPCPASPAATSSNFPGRLSFSFTRRQAPARARSPAAALATGGALVSRGRCSGSPAASELWLRCSAPPR